MGLSRNIFFSCICYFMLLPTYANHNRNHNQICIAPRTESYRCAECIRPIPESGAIAIFYFSFSTENVKSSYILLFFGLKMKVLFRDFLFFGRKRKILYGQPLLLLLKIFLLLLQVLLVLLLLQLLLLLLLLPKHEWVYLKETTLYKVHLLINAKFVFHLKTTD